MKRTRSPKWRRWLRCKPLTKLGSVLLGFAFGAALVTWAARASAYRTAASDPKFAGTERVRWATDQIALRLNTDTPSELGFPAVEAAVVGALAEWNGPSCGRLTLRYEATTSLAAAPGDGVNTIQWIRQGWTARGYDRAAAAITDVQYEKGTDGQWRIVEADLYLNGDGERWTTGVPAGRERNIASVVVHEAGHILGLFHPCEMGGAEGAPDCGADPSYTRSVLYPIYSPAMPSLSADDTAGECFLYPGLRCEVEGCRKGAVCRASGCVVECGGAICGRGEECLGGACVVPSLALGTSEISVGPDGGARMPFTDDSVWARGALSGDASGLGCSEASDCPDGACVKNAAGLGVCMARQPFGAACSSASECLGGQCLAKGSERGVCTGACADGGAQSCPLGWTCEPIDGTPVCKPPELAGGGDGDTVRIRCSLSPIAPCGPAPFGAAAGLLALLAFCTRRQTSFTHSRGVDSRHVERNP